MEDFCITGWEDIFICEGETDTLAALSHGIVAVGLPGANTTHFMQPVQRFDRFGCVYLATDNDLRGEQAAEEIYRFLRMAGMRRPWRIQLLPGQDVGDRIQELLKGQGGEE